jgi:hypothetical protein
MCPIRNVSKKTVGKKTLCNAGAALLRELLLLLLLLVIFSFSFAFAATAASPVYVDAGSISIDSQSPT